MINLVPAGRRSRAGTGVLPPNPAQWDCEHHALDLRQELGLGVGAKLVIEDVFDLLPNTVVIPHGQIAMANVYADHFRAEGSGRWSGLAIRLDDGSDLIVYNDSHPDTRVRATLMEEFFHLKLNHPRSHIQLLGDGTRARTFDDEVERIAYGSGAAALVPFCRLKEMLADGASSSAIAHAFGVSTELVSFRMKVTKLYRSRRPRR
jgi:Zn-dependent peptidase ImmA (M78 family)